MMTGQNSASEKIFNEIVLMLSKKTGCTFRETHKNGILRYIEKRIVELKISIEEYGKIIRNELSETELTSLVNASTVNETYFFREEGQFDFLKKILSSRKNFSFWSAACSSGEEIYSVKLLCDFMKVDSQLFASDINTEKLKFLKDGIYNSKQSTREIDGKKYHDLLKPYLKGEEFSFPSDIKNSIGSAKINLVDFDSYGALGERKFDVVFLRNVFIYLPLEERYRILKFIAKNHLKADGYIFVSLSETAQIEEKCILPDLEKICEENVFVFHKKSEEKEVQYE